MLFHTTCRIVYMEVFGYTFIVLFALNRLDTPLLLFMGILPNDKRMGIWLISPLFLVIILRSFCGDTWKEHGYHLNILYDHFAMLFNSTFDFSL